MSEPEETTRAEAEMARLLTASRPRPRSSFRTDLRQRLIAPTPTAQQSAKPPRLALLVGAYAGSGGLLLAAVALGVAGVGPFGP